MKKTNLTLLLLCLVIVAAAQIPTDSLVGYWPFNGNANDVSGSNHSVIINGATLTTDRFGNDSSAYNFDGNDWIEVIHSDLIDFDTSSNFSLSVWALIDPSHANGSILEKWNPVNNINKPFPYNIRCHTKEEGYRYSFGIFDNSGHSTNNNTNTSESGISFNTENFYHIAVTYENKLMSLYINGTLADTSLTNFQQNISNNDNLYIGRRGYAQDRYFRGKIDDLRIYSRALEFNEIHSLYNESNCSDTITNDTILNYVSNIEFQALSPKLYYDFTDTLVSNYGCDSIVNYYNSFIYHPIYHTDTIGFIDTIPFVDTIVHIDTVLFIDSIPFVDTLIHIDSVTYLDTIIFNDTIQIIDSIQITDTLTYIDTIQIIDSISVTDTLLIDIAVAINTSNAINTLKVYPNPTSDIIWINCGDFTTLNNYTIKLIDSSGLEKWSEVVSQKEYSIDLSGFATGLYFIEIYDDTNNRIEQRKIILH